MSPTAEIARSLGTLDIPSDREMTASYSASCSLVSSHLVAIPAPYWTPAFEAGESDFTGADFMSALRTVSRRKTLVEQADEGMRSIRDGGGISLADLKSELGM